MEPVQVSAGAEVIEQGAKGDYFYVIETGSYEVLIVLVLVE